MAKYKINKEKAMMLYQALSRIEDDYFSDRPKFGTSKDSILGVIKAAGATAYIQEEYNKMIDTHKRIFLKEAGFTPSAAAQSTESDNRLLASNMTTYFSIDDGVRRDIEAFKSSEVTIEINLTGLSDTLLPHEIRNAIKEFCL